MHQFKSEQEAFWSGEFGMEYITRNQDTELLACNVNLFKRILASTQCVKSILEFGANIGMNLQAMQRIKPELNISAVEINEVACTELKKLNLTKIYHQSLLDFKVDYPRDFVLTKGVLIHVSPDYLDEVYQILYEASDRYICIAEYYSLIPAALPYRGHANKLFKRDFAGEMLERYPNLKLIDYNFCYHRDKRFGREDLTWFLLEK